MILLKRLLIIENNLKFITAYNFSEKYGYKNYLTIENFDLNQKKKGKKVQTPQARYSEVMEFLARIQSEIAKNIKGHNSISHYMLEHGYVPLWVLMNVLSFGTGSLFYRNMKQPDKQKI